MSTKPRNNGDPTHLLPSQNTQESTPWSNHAGQNSVVQRLFPYRSAAVSDTSRQPPRPLDLFSGVIGLAMDKASEARALQELRGRKVRLEGEAGSLASMNAYKGTQAVTQTKTRSSW